MVPVYSERLRAAIEVNGRSVADVAQQLKEHPQTLAYLAAGDGVKRCRRSRRARLAKVLLAPEEWLGGEPVAIPRISFMPGGGFDFLYSPRTELAASRLMTKCVQACQRDLADPSLRDPEIDEDAPAVMVSKFVTWFVGDMMKVSEWRKDLLVGPSKPWIITAPMIEDPFNPPPKPPKDPEHEAATLGLIVAIEHVLDLWFTGKAKLNYRRLRERIGFVTPTSDRRSDTNPYAVIIREEPKGGVQEEVR